MPRHLISIALALFVVAMVTKQSKAVPRVVTERCWAYWSECAAYSSYGTGTRYGECKRRCQCLGWTTGGCIRDPECDIDSGRPWKCNCRGTEVTLDHHERVGLCSLLDPNYWP